MFHVSGVDERMIYVHYYFVIGRAINFITIL